MVFMLHKLGGYNQVFIRSDKQHTTHCQSLDAADMSHSLKMVALWQPWRPQHNTVEGWMPPVNIYLPCECVSVCGTAWRQELLWGFICSMTRQPVIYEHLVLLFKLSLISRQTFPEARAEQEWPRPDKTSHRLSASHPTWVECGARKLGTVHQSVCLCLQYVLYECSPDSWEQQCDITEMEIICSEFYLHLTNWARG